ncbi:MAG: amidohydrolase family protein [Bacteroidia bacterium]|nr:amidohydrolase family protein [Bacteroidia bacterium]
MKLQLSLFFSLFLCSFFACTESAPPDSTFIKNVLIVDGTGAKAYKGALRISGQRIYEIGDLSEKSGEDIIDGQGKVLAPGFIDTHSHHDLSSMTDYMAAMSQGVSTIVVGQDGFSKYPIKDFFQKVTDKPGTLNIASYIGHNTLRGKVLGEKYQRKASTAEVEEMRKLLLEEMASGALGLSSGLEYDPGIYSDKSEVISLAKELKALNGRYISHMRSEDMKLEEAIEEIIDIGKQAGIPVQISHFKLARKSLWGKAGEMLARLDQVRAEGIEITADVYPYEYWQSTMTVLFPKRDFDNIASARHALTELTSPEGMIIAEFEAEKSYEGKTLAEIAKKRGEDPAVTYMKLIDMSQKTPGESIIARSMTEADIYTLLNWPHANLCSDGSPTGHPRGWGSFPRYFSNAQDIPIEKRIEKMTSLAAKHIGIADRGILEKGAYADLVLLDPDELKDKATFKETGLKSQGVLSVWVNGTKVYDGESATEARPGKLIKRKGF